jgi:DNA polymerase III delta subunit
MSTFSQWRTAHAKSGVKQITWVCGTEQVLIEEVVRTIKDDLAPESWNYIPLSVGEDTERSIWSEIDQHPIDSGMRLVVIRNAERIKDWFRLEDWIRFRNLNPNSYLVFVSNEDRLQRLPVPEGAERGTKGAIAPHIAALSGKGTAVECRPYTQATAKYAVKWVQEKAPMRDGIAGYLLDRANGDLRLVRDICEKLAVFPDDISITTVNALLSEQPRDDFSDALMALDKKTALLSLEQLPESEYSRTLGLLDSRLDLAGLVHDMQSEYKSPSQISAAAGSKAFLVKDILPVSKHYDRKRRLQIRKVLATADEALRSGNSIAVLEAVVALW